MYQKAGRDKIGRMTRGIGGADIVYGAFLTVVLATGGVLLVSLVLLLRA